MKKGTRLLISIAVTLVSAFVLFYIFIPKQTFEGFINIYISYFICAFYFNILSNAFFVDCSGNCGCFIDTY